MKSRTYGYAEVTPDCPLVSVVIVNFNAGCLLRETLRGVFEQAVPLEVIVVDNDSSDGSIASLRRAFGADPRLSIVQNRVNLGFAAAANIGLHRARAPFLLLLNPDCVPRTAALNRTLEVLRSDPAAGMAGCLIRNPDGSEQAGCRRAVPTPWRSLVRVLRLNRVFPHHPRFRTFNLHQEPLPTTPAAVEAISGAFMLVRRETMEQVGLLDAQYFLHCEDLDWCMRFRERGWNILFVPSAEVIHYKGTCSRARPIRVEWHKHRGMVRFYRKFFRHQYPRLLLWAVDAGVWSRFGLLASRELLQRALRGNRFGADRETLPARGAPEVSENLPRR